MLEVGITSHYTLHNLQHVVSTPLSQFLTDPSTTYRPAEPERGSRFKQVHWMSGKGELIEARVISLVESVALRKVALDESLLDSGLIDSIAAVDLALQIEQEFCIVIPAEKIHEYMRTARSLVAYVLASHH